MSRSRIGVVAATGLVAVGLGAVVQAVLLPAWVTFPTAVPTAAPSALAIAPAPVGYSPSPPPAVAAAPAVSTAAGMTPPMGWNGYNRFHLTVSAATVQAAARAMVASGMQAAGYDYVNLDGGWALRWRAANGALMPDPAKFPHGMKAVADYVHSLGLKFGIYASAGTFNCAGTSAGSYGHFRQDAATFAAWTVDYLKLDWCDIPYLNYPRMNHRQVSQMLAIQMRDALVATGRRFVYDANDWANGEPWTWARGLAAMWRTTPDIQDNYRSMLGNFTSNVTTFAQAGQGGWNDPDMLEVGNGGMSAGEYRSQFSLWAEMAAPLIAGNDLTNMSESTRSILTNADVIAVDQDPLGRQGYPVASADGHWVLTKPLSDGRRAVLFFNETATEATITATAAQVGLASSPGYTAIDLWSGAVTESTGVLSFSVPAHGVVMFTTYRGRLRTGSGVEIDGGNGGR